MLSSLETFCSRTTNSAYCSITLKGVIPELVLTSMEQSVPCIRLKKSEVLQMKPSSKCFFKKFSESHSKTKHKRAFSQKIEGTNEEICL